MPHLRLLPATHQADSKMNSEEQRDICLPKAKYKNFAVLKTKGSKFEQCCLFKSTGQGNAVLKIYSLAGPLHQKVWFVSCDPFLQSSLQRYSSSCGNTGVLLG